MCCSKTICLIITDMRCALVTGGTRGIGRAVCDLLAAENYSIIIGYNNSHAAACDMVEKYQSQGINCLAVRSDLSESAGAEKLLQAIQGFPKPDTLINNAGRASFGLISDVTDEELQRVFNLNFFSPLKLIRELSKTMVDRRFGRIVNITSMWALTGSSNESVYSASKAALTGLTKSLAKELGGSGITVNCVAPGMIDTDMNSCLAKADVDAILRETPLARFGKPCEVAKAVRLLIDKDCFINGETVNVSGGLVIT